MTTKTEQAITLRQSGLSLRDIAKIVGVSHGTIRSWTKSIQISETNKLSINSKNNKYKYNTDIFTTPNSLAYYFLGVCITDGCVDQNQRRITIVSKDKEWLETISKSICNNKPLHKVKNKNAYTLTINSKFISNWLIDNECVPNKSLTVKLPNIPDEYLPHFVRGVFDGDGCITIHKKNKNLFMYIVSASKSFATDLSNKLNHIGITNKLYTVKDNRKTTYHDCYRIFFTGQKSINFCEFLYSTSEIFLQRKYDKYQEFEKEFEKDFRKDLGCNESSFQQ